ELGLGRLTEDDLHLFAVLQISEPLRVCQVTSIETFQSARTCALKNRAKTLLRGAQDLARVSCQQILKLAIVERFAPCPAHVNAASELIQALGKAANRLHVLLIRRVRSQGPRIHERNSGIEEIWPENLRGGPNLRHP